MFHCKPMFWLKCVYWFCFVRWSSPGRFLSVLFVHIGLSDSQIGILYALQKSTNFIATPIWSMIADKIKNRYIIYQITIIGSSFGILLLGVPYFVLKLQNSDTMFICMIIACFIYFVFNQSTGSLQDSLVLLHIEDKMQYGSIRMYGAIGWGITHILIGLLLDFVIGIQWTLVISTVTAIPCCIIGHIAFGNNSGSKSKEKKSERQKNELKQTQLLSVSSESVNDEAQIDDENGKVIAVEMSSIPPKEELVDDSLSDPVNQSVDYQQLNGTSPRSTTNSEDIDLDANKSEIENPSNASTEETSNTESVSMREFIGFMIAKPSTISLYFLMFSVGGGQSVATSLLFPYVLDIGTEKYSDFLFTLLGTSVAVTVIFEIPIFRISEWIIKRMGYKNMMIFGAILLIIRCIGYSLLDSNTLWCLVFIEPLHGTTFALMQLSSVNIMADLFGEKYAATAQGSANSIKGGIGPLLFILSSGFVMQYISGQWMYRGVAIWLIFALTLFVITTRKEHFNSKIDK